MAAAGNPALARDTFMDKVLEPWTRGAKDEGAARQYASSYQSYVAEREEAGRPYDPVGKMTGNAGFDTCKLPGSADKAEVSKVGGVGGLMCGPALMCAFPGVLTVWCTR